MSATLDRLRTLRRQTGQAPTPAAASPRPASRPAATREDSPQSIDDLRRLLRTRASALNVRSHAHASDRTLPGVEMAPGLRLIERTLPCEPPPDLLCGAFARRMTPIPAANVMSFDTETTGLAGGTGTRAFMIGIGQWTAAGLRIRQWLMTTMAAERCLLAEFAATLDRDTILTSYNGKSYDAPLLAARFRLARLRNPLPGLDHIDLLHPARRRYRGRWENCRLATIERRVLGIVREDDLPGGEAPAAWLGYLRGGSSRNLCRVADHNRQDLVSLMGLLEHLSEADLSTT